MSENTSPLKTLIELGKLDASIAQSALQQKALERTLAEKASLYERAMRDLERRSKEIEHRKREVDQVERRLKDEQTKLVERRKALATFSTYKLQQAAAREIENSAKQISEQEGVVLQELDAIEKTSTELETRRAEFETFEKEFKTLEEDTKGELEAIAERMSEKQQQREALLHKVDRKLLSEYNRVQHRHAQDALVPLLDGHQCGGCHMHLTAQIALQLVKGEGLVRCRGCGRILYMPDAEGAELAANEA